MFCTSCGVRSESDDQRFCTGCGAAFSDGNAAPTVVTPVPPGFPVPPPPPAPPAPPLPPSAPKRSRGPVLLVAALAVLAALLGSVVAVLVLSDDDGRRTASDGNSDEAGERGKDDSSADPDDGPSPSPSPSKSVDASTFTCWNDVPAERLSDCTAPSGKQGMTWVFPQSKASGCSFTGGGARVAEADCDVVVSSGGTVRVHYTEWADRDSAYAEYSGQNVQGAVTDWREFHRWYISPRAGDWDYKVALLYRDAPWSVTVYGHTKADRDEALRELSVRPVSDLMGERAA